MTARVPAPPGFDPRDPVDRANLAAREQDALEEAWKTIRAASLGPVVVMIDKAHVRYSSQPGKNAIEATFQPGHLAGLEAVCVMLRRMLGVS